MAVLHGRPLWWGSFSHLSLTSSGEYNRQTSQSNCNVTVRQTVSSLEIGHFRWHCNMLQLYLRFCRAQAGQCKNHPLLVLAGKMVEGMNE